jgi:hypothetical protein
MTVCVFPSVGKNSNIIFNYVYIHNIIKCGYSWCEYCKCFFSSHHQITGEAYASIEFRGEGLLEVQLQTSGIMRDYFPYAQFTLALKDEATLADLYKKIGESIGDKLPEAIWNREKSRFRGPVLLTSNGKLIREEATQLHDGQKIELRRYLVGG